MWLRWFAKSALAVALLGLLVWSGKLDLARLTAIRPFVDGEGISRCRLVLDPVVVRTRWQPRRAFQGWRYLKAEDAPGDAGSREAIAEMPPALRKELAELGLL